MCLTWLKQASQPLKSLDKSKFYIKESAVFINTVQPFIMPSMGPYKGTAY